MSSRIADLMRRHALVVTATSFGVIVGLVLRIPMFPYVLPEETANVLGAAVGAIFAVWGAAWLSDRKEKHAHLLAVQAIGSTIEPALKRVRVVEAGLEAALAIYDSGADRDKRIESIKAALSQAEPIPSVMQELDRRLDFLKPLFLQLGGPGAIAYSTLANVGSALRGNAEQIPWATFYDERASLEAGLAELRAKNESVVDQATRALDLIQQFAQGSLVARVR